IAHEAAMNRKAPVLPLLTPMLLALLLAGCAAPAAMRGAPAGAEAAVAIDAPPADWQALDGQRVRITEPLVVSGNHRLGRDGSVVAAFGERRRTPTEVALPGAAAEAVADANRARSLVLVLPERAAGHPRTWRAGGVLEG